MPGYYKSKFKFRTRFIHFLTFTAWVCPYIFTLEYAHCFVTVNVWGILVPNTGSLNVILTFQKVATFCIWHTYNVLVNICRKKILENLLRHANIVAQKICTLFPFDFEIETCNFHATHCLIIVDVCVKWFKMHFNACQSYCLDNLYYFLH